MQLTTKSCSSAPSSVDYSQKIKSRPRHQPSSSRHLMPRAHRTYLKKRSIQNSPLSNTAHLQPRSSRLCWRPDFLKDWDRRAKSHKKNKKIHQRFQKLQMQTHGEIYFNSSSASAGHLQRTGHGLSVLSYTWLFHNRLNAETEAAWEKKQRGLHKAMSNQGRRWEGWEALEYKMQMQHLRSSGCRPFRFLSAVLCF